MNGDVKMQHFDKFDVQSKIKFWNNYSQKGNEKKTVVS